ncbi:MAG: VWA domain-containing protein [Pyrinomonadaceae bacterium]|nr:VWA domain-containing protein [Pyrinomonadaceae bacterium]
MGLDKTAFTIYDNNVPQPISYFENASQPLSVGIIVGMHGSKASFDRREVPAETVVKLGLRGFIRASHSGNRYFLQSFYRGVDYLSDWTQDGTAIIDSVGQAKFRGGPLLDACYAGVEKLINEGSEKRVLLVVSDGMDDNSRRKLEELRRLVKGSDVLIYSIPLTPHNSSGGSLYMEGLGFLNDIAAETGGRFYEPKSFSVVSNIFELIALELGHQYAIGYRPLNFVDDGKQHRIKLKVKAPTDGAGNMSQLIIRTRETYLANPRLLKTSLDQH